MSVWTTSSTGLDTVLATLGSTIGTQTHNNALLHHQSQSQQHLLSLPSKSHSAHHLNIVSSTVNGGLSATASTTNGSGSSPNHSGHHHNHLHNLHTTSQAHHLNAIHHHQYQTANSNYNSSNHLFLPYQHQNSTSANWNKSSNIYQQKVIKCILYSIMLSNSLLRGWVEQNNNSLFLLCHSL